MDRIEVLIDQGEPTEEYRIFNAQTSAVTLEGVSMGHGELSLLKM
ncbi:hypothetical protein [Salinicoccus sp. CNSTN-B1]